MASNDGLTGDRIPRGAGAGGFVRQGLPDFLLHEVQEIEEEGREFSATGRCHYVMLRHFGF